MQNKKDLESEPGKQTYEIEDDYAVHSRIANSRGMPVVEGYPVIARSIFELVHLEPDDNEYSAGDPMETEENGLMNPDVYSYGVGEEYSEHRRNRRKIGYD